MAVPEVPKPFKIIAGDAWSQPLGMKVETAGVVEVEDLSGWENWECHWRPSYESSTFLALTVTVDAEAGLITVSATGDDAEDSQTRAMGQEGVADVQATPVGGGSPRTFVRFSTSWFLDVTRDV